MKRTVQRVLVAVLILSQTLAAESIPKEFSPESRECIDCHSDETPGLCQQWGASRHYRARVGCYECHQEGQEQPYAYKHYGMYISSLVTPKDCARCHEQQAGEFLNSHHAKAGRIMGSLDNYLAEVVEGNRGMVTPGFPHGVSAAAVNGCWQCHGSQIKVLADGKLDPATYPNTGVGRINPDGSEGACNACHFNHRHSVEQARNPETCGRCHMGPDHPQLEIFNESKHGIAYNAYKQKMALDNAKWVVGEDYTAAPNCATCHMSATRDQPTTHNIGLRLSWNNRPPISVRPETSDAKWNLESARVSWEQRRKNMENVCGSCHEDQHVANFYAQYDGLIDLYNEKFAKPGQALMALAQPLKQGSPKFAHILDWTWFELWHHEGRRARHGAAMMGPDFTHWHGTYEIAKHWYVKLVPELRELIAHHRGDPALKTEVAALETKLNEVLNHPDHQWYVGKEDSAAAARRRKAQEDFKARYK